VNLLVGDTPVKAKAGRMPAVPERNTIPRVSRRRVGATSKKKIGIKNPADQKSAGRSSPL